MNSTNKGINRVILFLVGLGLLAVGAIGLAVTLAPGWGDHWTSGMGSAERWIRDMHDQTIISDGSTVSWLALGALLLLAIVAVVAVVIIARVPESSSNVLICQSGGESAEGPIEISDSFAADAIANSLAGADQSLSSRVRSASIRGERVMQVIVTPRRGVLIADVLEPVNQLIDNFAVLAGRPLPTCIAIRSGIRARIAADNTRVE